MRKTTTISKNLKKQLTKYGALTAAIIGSSNANGQIVYTDIIPDFAGGIGSATFLDIDGNSLDDFRVHHNGGSNLYISPLTPSNEVLGSGGATFAYPFALSSGVTISSGAGSWFNNGYFSGFQSLNYGSCSFGNWCSVTDRYIGLRFNIGGNIHYGWARLDVDSNGSVWTVKDYAYNTIQSQAIDAGQVLGVESFNVSDIKIVALNKSIALYNLLNATEYTLYNMAGQRILQGSTSQDSYVIEANAVTSGVYIVELITKDSKATLRKKVVL